MLTFAQLECCGVSARKGPKNDGDVKLNKRTRVYEVVEDVAGELRSLLKLGSG